MPGGGCHAASGMVSGSASSGEWAPSLRLLCALCGLCGGIIFLVGRSVGADGWGRRDVGFVEPERARRAQRIAEGLFSVRRFLPVSRIAVIVAWSGSEPVNAT